MPDPSLDDQKRVAYYSAAVGAWFTTSLEHDRGLLTLSAAGIGLHLTLLTTVGLTSSEALVLYIGAILSFTASLLAILRIFRANQKHIEDIIASRVSGTDPALGRLDLFAIVSFGTGVVLTAVVGIGAAVHSHSEKEKSMAGKQQSQGVVPLRESVNGASGLQPPAHVEKSFNGAASIQPAQSQPASQVSQSTSQTTAPAPQSSVTAQTPSPPAPSAK